jgi:hypothetical protein
MSHLVFYGVRRLAWRLRAASVVLAARGDYTALLVTAIKRRDGRAGSQNAVLLLVKVQAFG